MVPLLWQGIGQRQPQREEEKHVHQHFAVELRLLLRSSEGCERGKDDFMVTWCTRKDGDIEDTQNRCR